MKRLNAIAISLAILAAFAGSLIAQLKKPVKAPSSVLHVITVKWKADSTPEQRQAALDGVKKMAAEIPGIANVWLKTVKVQPSDYNAVIAIEFKDKAAFDAYGPHESHTAWEKIYLPIRERSTTHDVTN
jgi:ABC-type glycerol-3-phosphate transport system substrate-binding protein